MGKMSNTSDFILAVALVLCISSVAVNPAHASDNSLSFFKYATPLEIPQVASARIAELEITEEMHNVLRDDFADLRIILNSNKGVVPAKVSLKRGVDGRQVDLVAHDVKTCQQIPPDLMSRFPDSRILFFEVGFYPVNSVQLSLFENNLRCDYLLLGRSSIHAAGSEWRLLRRGRIPGEDENSSSKTVMISFNESKFSQYAIVMEVAGEGPLCKVEMAWGPVYSVYFEVHPENDYTLLCGYPDAVPVPEFNTAVLERMLEKGEVPVPVRISSLVENGLWKGTSLKGFVLQRSFLIPLAVVLVLAIFLLVFVISYSVAHRKRPFKTVQRPRFYK